MLQALKDRWDHSQEWRRKIDQKKVTIDPSSIVLLDDFLRNAFDSVAEKQPRFGNIFGTAESIDRLFDFHARLEQISRFYIPLEVVEGKTRSDNVSIITEWVNQQIQEMTSDRKEQLESKGFYYNYLLQEGIPEEGEFDGQSLEERSRLQTIDFMVSETKLSAFFVQDLVKIMSLSGRNILFRDGVDRYEFSSLLSGEGRQTFNFWELVGELKDYSDHFPNKPKLRGNRLDDDSSKVRVGQPALG